MSDHRQEPQRVSDPQTYPEVLHLGCGKKKYQGSYGVDCSRLSDADLVWDLEQRPWPLPENTFKTAYLVSVLEHVDDVVGVMEELHRVCRPGAEIRIYAPFASSHHVWTDPTHKRGFTSQSFKYFTEDFAENYFEYSTVRYRILDVRYNYYEDWIWVYRPKWYERWILKLASRYKSLYEKRFMYWYPVQTIFFQLEVIK